jgi:hypothetical protein
LSNPLEEVEKLGLILLSEEVEKLGLILLSEAVEKLGLILRVKKNRSGENILVITYHLENLVKNNHIVSACGLSIARQKSKVTFIT